MALYRVTKVTYSDGKTLLRLVGVDEAHRDVDVHMDPWDAVTVVGPDLGRAAHEVMRRPTIDRRAKSEPVDDGTVERS